jgi:hypothetical protein
MTIRSFLRGLVLSGFVLVFAAPVSALTSPQATDKAPAPGLDAELNDGHPIVATVIEVNEEEGRLTLDTEHGRLDLAVSQDVLARLTPGDVIVLRLADDEADDDSPSASPREAPNRI